MSSNPMNQEIARLMTEGQAAARRGDRAMARTLLSQLVEQDPHNEEAWMWLSGVVTEASEQQICLENALVINPHNSQARRGLDFLVAKSGMPSRILPAPPAPPAHAAPASPAMDPPATFAPDGAQHPQYDPASAAVPAMPESWAVPGPEPADPFVAMPPYAPSMDASFAGGNGHTGNTGGLAELADTVPYTAPEPEPSNMNHAPGVNGEVRNSGGLGGMTNGSGTNAVDEAVHMGGADSAQGEPAVDTPFLPPGWDNPTFPDPQPAAGFVPLEGKLSHEDTATDLPAWLENLTPSASASEAQDSSFAPYDMSNFGSSSGAAPTGMMPGMNVTPSGGPGSPDPNMPFGAPAGMGAAAAMPPMSPFSEMQLPSPNELPGDDGRAGSAQAQPWYLQGSSNTMAPPMPTGGISNYLDSTMLNSSHLSGAAVGAAVLDEKRTKGDATVECPNCKEHVPDTSLACPKCQYNFFVNCPACHELVDTAGAEPGKVESCPYCKASINRMELGLGGVRDLVSQKNPGSKPAAAAAMTVAFPTMQQDIPGVKAPRRGLRFDWVVDLLWLVVVVLMVWALTQLPTWLNLPGMY